MIKIRDLNKFYNAGKSNQIHVIDDVNLDLPDTGFISLLGQSGSGKTTLLNVIGGLDKATGTIEYDDVEITNYRMKKIDSYRKETIGYVFQNYNLLTDKTVYENLRIALEVIDIVDKDEVDKRIEYALRAVGLYKFRKKPAYALSGGQMQRVSIARALVKKSKIIIADEPTGNLDSENSVEIMNILKKISQTSLVLLVTHDKQLAEFYSDEIVEIKDGQIIEIRNSNKDASLKGKKNNNTIFLKDLNELTGGDSNVRYRLYLQDEKVDDFELTIVQVNNQFFLKSNHKIRLLEDTPLELVDDHYKEIKKEDIEQEFTYDTSWFNEKKNSHPLERIKNNFVSAFKEFFHSRKRSKFFHVAFVLIGLAIGFLNISYVNYSNVDTSSFIYDKDLYNTKEFAESVSDEFFDDYGYMDFIRDAFKHEIIDEVYREDSTYINILFYQNSFQTIYMNANTMYLPDYLMSDSALLAGKYSSNENEVVIGKDLADNLLKQVNNQVTYAELLGYTLKSYPEKRIVGVCDKKSTASYFKQNQTRGGYLDQYDNNQVTYYEAKIGYKDYEEGKYDIIYGADLNNSTEGFLLNIKSVFSNEEDLTQENIQETADKYKNYTITTANGEKTIELVGIFKPKNFQQMMPSIIVDNETLLQRENFKQICCNKDAVSYKVLEGKDISSRLECLVSVYSKYDVGSTIGDAKVVGKYVLNSDNETELFFGSQSTALVDRYTFTYLDIGVNMSYVNTILFRSSNMEALRDYFQENGYTLINNYEFRYRREQAYNEYNRRILRPIMIVLIAISLIYIYFSMRSKMIQDIYSIGVQRALGFSRTRMLGKYAVSIFVTTLFTTLLGYLLTSGLYEFVAVNVGETTLFNNLSTYVLLLSLIILNIIIGLIPIATLMRKTPSEIIAKYDI